MEIKIPLTATKATDKIEFAYIAQEALRLEHNKQGAAFLKGDLSKEDWELWKENYFRPRSNAIGDVILASRAIFKQSKAYSVDLEKDFV